jgi:sterol desaturase/sphingolipid hydroxylase (fatty acid hydroxylase superfamily)
MRPDTWDLDHHFCKCPAHARRASRIARPVVKQFTVERRLVRAHSCIQSTMRLTRVLRAAFFVGFAGVVLLLERKRRARPYVESLTLHTGRNLVVAGLAAATVQALEAPVVVPLARIAAHRRWGAVSRLPGPAWLHDVLAVVLLDYTLYIWHILVHKVPWLWRFHLVHHVDLDLDASTGVRFHAGELAVSIPWRAAQVVAIGVTPRALTIWQSLTLASVLFHHSNTRLSRRAERILSCIIATPKMHAIHHSIDPAQLHSNFSSGLAIWDWIHGTARFDADPGDVTIGVLGHMNPDDVALARILELPFTARALPPASHV